MIQRELTMTVICVCGNQFGAWRSQCPACGTAIPPSKREVLNTPRMKAAETRRVKAAVARQPVWHECAFCHMRGAKHKRCAICHEPVHGGCAVMHEKFCAEFQTQVAAELKRLEETDNGHLLDA